MSLMSAMKSLSPVSSRAIVDPRILTYPFLTNYLYHLTPLIEYYLEHIYMYPRSRVLGSLISLNHIIMHMHSSVIICTHMHSHARICDAAIQPQLHMSACECIRVHMITDECICNALWMHSFMGSHLHASACICMHLHTHEYTCNALWMHSHALLS